MAYKILVVDDDEAVLDYLQAKIGSRYDLISTNTPENVVSLARQHRPDLIICDVDMPDMPGTDISRELEEDDRVREIPLLFLTGLATAEDMRRLEGTLGGRPAVAKSEPVDRLVARIDSLIRG